MSSVDGRMPVGGGGFSVILDPFLGGPGQRSVIT